MLPMPAMRTLVMKYASLGTKQPSYYFVQGYIMGLALNPSPIIFALWLADLFGETNPTARLKLDYFRAIRQLYQLTLRKEFDFQLALPAKCVLSRTDFERSLSPKQPLPQWCLGLLEAIKHIDLSGLDLEQALELENVANLLYGYTSVGNAQQTFGEINHDYRRVARYYKRQLPEHLSNTLFVMRQQFELISDELDLSDEILIIEQKCQQIEQAKLLFKQGQLTKAINQLQGAMTLDSRNNIDSHRLLMHYLIIDKQWSAVANVISYLEEHKSVVTRGVPDMFVVASQALMAFAHHGDCELANGFKKALKALAPYLVPYLTGQIKDPTASANVELFEQSVTIFYLRIAGKEAWRSVDGALFWLKRH